jgi:hypothetical protein
MAEAVHDLSEKEGAVHRPEQEHLQTTHSVAEDEIEGRRTKSVDYLPVRAVAENGLCRIKNDFVIQQFKRKRGEREDGNDVPENEKHRRHNVETMI